MKQLSNSESELLSAWCEAKKKLSKQSKSARETENQLKAMDKELRKIVRKSGKTVSNGEWNVSYENKPKRGYTVPATTYRKYDINKVALDYANVSKGGD